MMTDQTRLEFNEDEIDGSIIDRFERIVDCYRDRLAIKSFTSSLTYQELNQAANRVAQAIQQRQIQKRPIALIFDHDIPCLIAMLGVLKSGNAYTVLDVSAPLPHLTHLLADLQPDLLITNHQNLALATQLAEHLSLLNLDQLDKTLAAPHLNLAIPPDALSSIFYTSGSTGKPKGVERNHRQVLYRSYCEIADYKIDPQDRISFFYSCSFGASSSDIFNALLSGAGLYLYPVKEIALHELSHWLIQSEITILHLPVMLFQQWLDGLAPTQYFPKLRLVIPSGKLYRKDVEQARPHFSEHCWLMQRLASTETGAVTRFTITSHTEITGSVVPVGYVVPGYEISLVDDSGESVGPHQMGEILIKSRYLSPGYWQQPELTAQKFLTSAEDDTIRIYRTGDLGRMNSDGCLELVGRKDFMVKIRGYRVEPDEIESVLVQLDSIKQAVVVAQRDETDEPQLVAYIVPKEQLVPCISDIRHALLEKIPDYMIPNAFMVLETLPTTLNGKLDRSALPPVDWNRPNLDTAFVPPRTPLESQVADIWMAVFKLSSVGIHDNFLDLGGHSLQTMQIMTRVAQQFDVNIPIKLLFQAATVATMSNMIIQHQAQAMLNEHESLETRNPHQTPKILMKPREIKQIHFD